LAFKEEDVNPPTNHRSARGPVGEQAARSLDERLAARPQLRQRFEQILDIVERDSQTDCTADEAELRVRDQTRALAQEVLQHWAEDAAIAATARARQERPQAIGHAKKKSTGTAPSARSA
jgi:hypothetical protein